MEGICLKIYCLSAEHARKVKEKTNAILKENGLGELPPPLSVPNNRKVWCYPIQLAVPCPRLPVVEYLPERDQAMLRFHGDTLCINTSHLQKLVFERFCNTNLVLFFWNKSTVLTINNTLFILFWG